MFFKLSTTALELVNCLSENLITGQTINSYFGRVPPKKFLYFDFTQFVCMCIFQVLYMCIFQVQKNIFT